MSLASEIMNLKLRLHAAADLPAADRAAELHGIDLALAELNSTGQRRTLLPSEVAECRAMARSLERNGVRRASVDGATVTTK